MIAPLDSSLTLDVLDDCWNSIGVRGDASCPELKKHVHCHNCPTFSAASHRLFDRPTPPDYLEDWSQRLMQTIAPSAADTIPVVIFRLAAEWFAWHTRSVVEVAEPRVIRRIPHRTNNLLLGLVNIRGELQLCVSLRELLSIRAMISDETATSCPQERLLVVTDGSARWVFPVDEVAGVQRLPQDSLTNLPATVSGAALNFSRGVFHLEGRAIGFLSDEAIFPSLEGRIR